MSIPQAPDMHKEVNRQKRTYNELVERSNKHGLSSAEYSRMNRLHKHYNRKEYDAGSSPTPLEIKEHQQPHWKND